MKLNAAASMAEINQLYGGLDETPMIRENHTIPGRELYGIHPPTVEPSCGDLHDY